MKPVERLNSLEIVCDLIAADEPLPPTLKAWFCAAIRQRLLAPGRTIDQLLGVSSRAGGRCTAKTLGLHAALRKLDAGSTGTTSARAKRLEQRIVAYQRGAADPELQEIERRYGRLPGTARHITRVLAGDTESVRTAESLESRKSAVGERAAPTRHHSPSVTLATCWRPPPGAL